MRDKLAGGSPIADGDPTATTRRPDADTPPVSQDNVFDALASRRGRYVLACVREAEAAVDIEDVVECVATWETGKPIDLVSEEHRERVATSLTHTQLPKLSMMGMVEYDEREGVVRRGPHAEQADAYLDVAIERDGNVDL
ncbi:DUF7344 domain-containing protein [Halorussus marinus]|uniref:DUF7344 domain-containing protein n=1 Tax=Halorussus marinus TaxID=2505976 RepID=UPI00106EBAC5|nr:hypothetical protein [Halorussus marinus]